MSQAHEGGANSERFLKPAGMRDHFDLVAHYAPSASELDRSLSATSVGRIAIPISHRDFKAVFGVFDELTYTDFRRLADTYHAVDSRFGHEAGFQRKEKKFEDGKQTDDPKSFFHFNEKAWARWGEQFEDAPQHFREFLEMGMDLQRTVLGVARLAMEQLEATHPNITRAHFTDQNGNAATHSFLRLVSYDPYIVTEEVREVGKAHYDLADITFQLFADAPGFWGARSVDAERQYLDTPEGTSLVFPGRGYEKMYAGQRRFDALYHGITQQEEPVGSLVPARHAAILFLDAPAFDPELTKYDSLPELYRVGS